MWNIKDLELAHLKDLTSCTSKLERDNCEAFHIMELRKLRDTIIITRQLTPGEVAILGKYL